MRNGCLEHQDLGQVSDRPQPKNIDRECTRPMVTFLIKTTHEVGSVKEGASNASRTALYTSAAAWHSINAMHETQEAADCRQCSDDGRKLVVGPNKEMSQQLT